MTQQEHDEGLVMWSIKENLLVSDYELFTQAVTTSFALKYFKMDTIAAFYVKLNDLRVE